MHTGFGFPGVRLDITSSQEERRGFHGYVGAVSRGRLLGARLLAAGGSVNVMTSIASTLSQMHLRVSLTVV
jgi:hypothetical protein